MMGSMGASSDNDPDRKADPAEDPVDDGWSTGSPVHNDRTTAGLYVDPSTLGKLTAGKAIPDHDRTAAALDIDRIAAGSNHDRAIGRGSAQRMVDDDADRTTIDKPVTPTEDSTVAAVDQLMADLEQPGPIVNNDRTIAGLGVATTATPTPTPTPRRPAFALLQPGKGTVPLEKNERALVQPERSPLDLVMGDLESPAPSKPHSSGDSSRFVASLMGDQAPPPRVEAESPMTTAMQPVLRRARLRRKWIALGALAATAVVGTALALTLSSGGDQPRPSASEAAKVAEPAEPVAAPAPENVAPAPSAEATPPVAEAPAEPSVEPPAVEAAEPPPAKPEVVAMANTTKSTKQPAKVTTEKPATAKKTVATKDVTAKKSSDKKATDKKATDKKSSDKKSTTTTAKKTATKPAAKKTASADKSSKKTSTTKKPSTTKKTTDKKPPAKKPTRSRRSKQTRRS
jgi:hypothetical protein